MTGMTLARQAWGAALVATLLVLPATTPAAAQPRGNEGRRVATTVGALARYAVFYHLNQVRVRGTLTTGRDEVSLGDGEGAVLLVGNAAAGLTADSTPQEVLGTFLDIGRLTQGDPRLTGIDVERIARARLDKPWPGVNELLVIVVASVNRAEPFAAPSLRAVALAPERYLESTVSVTGRFRGGNLYGDQPDAPGKSRYDFVLQSADASVWVVGLRPRGVGFNFSPQSRVDTDKWLTVSGVVRRERNLVFLEGARVTLAKPPSEPAEPVVRVPMTGPRPEVVFSTPTADETDIPTSTRIRIQFSRDLNPESIKGQVKVAYLGAQANERGEPQAPALAFTTSYDEGARVLEIRFPNGLERFRTVQVDLPDTITSTDGATLVPWTVRFTLGG